MTQEGTRQAGSVSGAHALVIGGSMAGLIAARVLSPHFDRVTIVDRDRLPTEIENRKGVPQGWHGHGLLASGFAGLKGLFPRLETQLADGGAITGDILGDARWFQHGYYKAKFQSGFQGILLSRPFLEGAIRQQVIELPNVRIIDQAHVTGLQSDIEGRRVTGAHVRVTGEPLVTYTADLVVDAGGRASKSPAWLEELGYKPPETDEVWVDLGYTTRTFKRRAGELGGDIVAIIAPKPPHQTRVGFMLALEGDRWMVSLSGWLGDHAPTDPEGFLAFAKSLPRPDIYEVIKDAEPLTDAVTYGFPSNLRRRYEALTEFPGRYLVMGDAMCSFNPIYGQGMSVATLEGLALANCLKRSTSLDGLARPFFKAASRIIDTPWTIAAGSDFAFPGVTGRQPKGNGVINWYLNYVHRAASTDRVVCRAFFDVANLLEPATTLFHPAIVARVVRACAAGSPGSKHESYRGLHDARRARANHLT